VKVKLNLLVNFTWEEEVSSRTETKRNLKVLLDADVECNGDSDHNDVSVTHSQISVVTREQLQFMQSNLKYIYAVLHKCIKDYVDCQQRW